MIPEKYAFDVKYRTLAREYEKNTKIVEAARRRHDVVASVVDAFSIELPFNGEEGGRRSTRTRFTWAIRGYSSWWERRWWIGCAIGSNSNYCRRHWRKRKRDLPSIS